MKESATVKDILCVVMVVLSIWLSRITIVHYDMQIFFGVMFICLLISVYLYEKFDLWLALSFFWVMLSGSLLSSHPFSPYMPMGIEWVNDMNMISGHSLIFVLISLALVFIVDSKDVIKGLGILAYVNSLLILLLSVFTQGNFAGVMLNLSMDATFIVIFFPYLVHSSKCLKRKSRLIFLAIPIIAVLLTKSSVGVGGLCVSILAYLIAMKKPSIKLFALPVAIGVAAYLYDYNLFNSTMRFENWERSMVWWFKNADIALGTGLGTYWKIGPWIQKIENPASTGLFNFMHSDWLQALFELGVVGFVFIAVLFVKTLVKSFSSPYIFSMVVTYGAVAVFNMPTKYIITSMAGALILKISLSVKGEKHNTMQQLVAS